MLCQLSLCWDDSTRYITLVTWRLVASCDVHRRGNTPDIRTVVTTVARTVASCRLHHPVHLSRLHLNRRNLQQQLHNSLHTHLPLVSNPNCRLKHPARTKAGRIPKPVCLPPRRAKIGP